MINGISKLVVQVLGEQVGKGVRSADGMRPLPGNIAVETGALVKKCRLELVLEQPTPPAW